MAAAWACRGWLAATAGVVSRAIQAHAWQCGRSCLRANAKPALYLQTRKPFTVYQNDKSIRLRKPLQSSKKDPACRGAGFVVGPCHWDVQRNSLPR